MKSKLLFATLCVFFSGALTVIFILIDSIYQFENYQIILGNEFWIYLFVFSVITFINIIAYYSDFNFAFNLIVYVIHLALLGFNMYVIVVNAMYLPERKSYVILFIGAILFCIPFAFVQLQKVFELKKYGSYGE